MNELYIGRVNIYFKSNSGNAAEVFKQLQEICFQNDIEFYFDGEAILRNEDGEDIDIYEEE